MNIVTFIKLGIKRQLKLKWIVVSLVIQTFLLLPIYWLLSRVRLGTPYHLFFLSELFLTLFVVPVVTSKSIINLCRRWKELSLTPVKSIEVLLGSLISGQFYVLLFLLCSFIVTNIITPFKWDIPFLTIFSIHIFLLICIWAYSAITALSVILTRNFLFSLLLTYFIISLFVGGIILATPMKYHIDNLESVKTIVMNINPIVAVCGILRLDIFRTQYLYELAPIGSSVLAYPAWERIGLWHLVLMLISLGISSIIFPKIVFGGLNE